MTWLNGGRASRLTVGVAAIATFLACRKEEAAVRVSDSASEVTASADTSRGTPQATSLIQWMFRPTVRERAILDSLLQTIATRYISNGKPLDGEIHRYATDTTGDRYIVVASIPGTSEPGDRPQLKFFILGISPPRVSAPSAPGISDALDHFAVSKIEDYDSDGNADLAYCIWDGPRGTPGTPRGIGYRDSSWYAISATTAFPRCEPQAEP